jgi:signal transduction histidine kinase
VAVSDKLDEVVISLANQPASSRERASVWAVALILLAAFVALLPFADAPLPELNAFIPSTSAVMSINDLITSVLLYTQFLISRAKGFLILASGYFFTALIIVPHALTFPGAFTATGLLGAGPQTAAWLYFSAHFVFPGALVCYALLKEAKRTNARLRSARSAVVASVAVVLALVGGLTLLTTVGNQYLPSLLTDRTRALPVPLIAIALTIMAIATLALVELWIRRRTVLDYWLLLIAFALILEEACFVTSRVRFTLGYYAGRLFWLFSSVVVLMLLLQETSRLYARLARSSVLQERERNNRILSARAITASIAHEVRQPLMAIAMNGGAAVQFLAHDPPNYAEVRSALDAIVNDSQRVSQIVESIGSLFRGDSHVQQKVDMNEVVRDVLQILGPDLRDNQIEVNTNSAITPPVVMGHRGQLQEVVINLVINAMEAMTASSAPIRALLLKTEHYLSNEVSVTVQDSGPGISADQLAHLFDAFTSTKSQGMGLGLAICKMIVERHGGEISAISNERAAGASFQFVLPYD